MVYFRRYHDGLRTVVLGRGEVRPVRNLTISRATASNQPTTLTFAPVRSRQVRLDMPSVAPGTATGFLEIVELQVLSAGAVVS